MSSIVGRHHVVVSTYAAVRIRRRGWWCTRSQSDGLRRATAVRDEVHDGEFPSMSWTFVESAMEIE